MEGFKAQGSFGIPESMQRMAEDAKHMRREAQEQPAKAPERQESVQPAKKETPAETAPTTQAQDDAAQFARAKVAWEESLGITIGENDLRDYIFRGRLVKGDITLACGAGITTKATFQSQTAEDAFSVDAHLAEFRSNVKFTAEGLENERAMRNLSVGWLEIDGKPLGKTPEDRYKVIRQMGALLIDVAVEAYRDFTLLIKLMLKEEKLLKKR